MAERWTVEDPGELFEFLATRLEGWHRNTVRTRLRTGCVCVNGATIVRAKHRLDVGDRVELADRPTADTAGPGAAQLPAGVSVLHTDADLIVIDKPAGLLSVATDRQPVRNALALMRESLSGPGRTVRLWPVHRLDRETSGVLLLARSRAACEQLRSDWATVRKVYLAVVQGGPSPASGTIDQPLWEDRGLRVHVGRRNDARQARTSYRTLQRAGGRTLLEVELETGRRHQIRAHLAWLGTPIVGDRRYGRPDTRMGLHAWRLEFPHPSRSERISVEAPLPAAVERLLGSAG